MSAPEVAPVHIKDLQPDPKNRRSHNPRNIGMISDALRAVGSARSIVIDEDNIILAGNGVTEAAAEAGITRLRVIEADGNELIAVRRSGLTADQKRALAIYDNRTSELATWNAEQLAADAKEGLDFAPFFFEDELKALLADSNVKAGHTDPDEVPPERATEIQQGDLFELGAHRLLCGDSTKADDLLRLMGDQRADVLTLDPPYGVGYTGGAGKEWAAFENDPTDSDTYGQFISAVLRGFMPTLDAQAALYLWFSDSQAEAVVRAVDANDWRRRAWIIWAKDRFIFSRATQHYRQQHEPCIYASRGTKMANWYGPTNECTIWQFDKPQAHEDHPTSKPTALYGRLISNSTSLGGIVAEGFGGSGSVLIAAEQLGRCCRAVELEPSYCQVIIDRWEAFTQQQAVKVGEAIRA